MRFFLILISTICLQKNFSSVHKSEIIPEEDLKIFFSIIEESNLSQSEKDCSKKVLESLSQPWVIFEIGEEEIEKKFFNFKFFLKSDKNNNCLLLKELHFYQDEDSKFFCYLHSDCGKVSFFDESKNSIEIAFDELNSSLVLIMIKNEIKKELFLPANLCDEFFFSINQKGFENFHFITYNEQNHNKNSYELKIKQSIEQSKNIDVILKKLQNYQICDIL